MTGKSSTSTLIFIALLLLMCLALVWKFNNEQAPQGSIPVTQPETTAPTVLLYTNDMYGFTVSLPLSWQGYSVAQETKKFEDNEYYEVRLVHPQLVKVNSRMDVPVLVAPIQLWNTWYPINDPESGQHPFAAPIPATERGRNLNYVFATAPRYNFSYLPGWEEVDEIVSTIKGF